MFSLLAQAGLVVKLSKCEFLSQETVMLGHVVSGDGIRMDPKKISAMVNYPTPTNGKSLLRFLGLTNFYRDYIAGFGSIVSPLYKLLKKDVQYDWSDECEASFQKLKRALTVAPVLRQPDYSKPFLVFTDASDAGIGGVLAQPEDGYDFDGIHVPEKYYVVCYCSRVLQDAETRYGITEKEGLAVVYALSKFRSYVLGQVIHVFTDHSALTQVITKKQAPTPRMTRWITKLMEYSPIFHYVPGHLHSQADALSRAPESTVFMLMSSPETRAGVSYQVLYLENDEELANGISEEVPMVVYHVLADSNRAGVSPDISSSTQDEFYVAMKAYLNTGVLPTHYRLRAAIERVAKEYLLIEDHLYHRGYTQGKVVSQWYVPMELRLSILYDYHDSYLGGHQGTSKTFDRIRHKYYWPGYYHDIDVYVQSCEVCQKLRQSSKSKTSTFGLMPVCDPCVRLGIDVLGPLPVTAGGHKYVVVMVDHGTRWPEAIPTDRVTASIIADILYKQLFVAMVHPRSCYRIVVPTSSPM